MCNCYNTFTNFLGWSHPVPAAQSPNSVRLRGIFFQSVTGAALLLCEVNSVWAACSPAAANSVIAVCTGATTTAYGNGTYTNGQLLVDVGASVIVSGTSAIWFNSLSNVSNSGTIRANGSTTAYGIRTTALDHLTNANTGLIAGYTSGLSGSSAAYGLYTSTSTTTIDSNAGQIFGSSARGNGYGVYGTGSGANIVITSNSGDIYGETNATSEGIGGYGVYAAASSVAIGTNTGTIRGLSTLGSAYGVSGQTSASVDVNRGTISAQSTSNGGVTGFRAAVTATVGNASSGTISALNRGAGSAKGLSAQSVTATNAGTISGSSASGFGYGILGSTATVSNAGSILGASTDSNAGGEAYAIAATGSVATLTDNTGDIGATAWGSGFAYGLRGNTEANVTSNAGSITASARGIGSAFGVSAWNAASISSNSGTIAAASDGVTGAGSAYGVYARDSALVANSGTISAASAGSGEAAGVYTLLTDASLTNTGSAWVSARTTGSGNAYGLYAGNRATVTANSGTVSASSDSGNAYAVYGSAIATVINTAIVQATSSSGSAYAVYGGADATLNNAMNVSASAGGTGSAYALYGDTYAVLINQSSGRLSAIASGSGNAMGVRAGTFATVSNAASAIISASSGSGNAYAVFSNDATTSINNSGSLYANATSGQAYGLYLNGGAANIINTGSITGQTASVYANAPVASVLNWQGGNAADAPSTALTWRGTLPQQYTLGVSSATRYGQIWFSEPNGTTAINLDASSTLALGSYAKALSGVSASAITSTSGTLGLMRWQLSLSDTNHLFWDLLVTPNGMALGESKAASTLNQTFVPYFFGGTLQIDSTGSTLSDNFVLDASSTNTVALGGNSATFSGAFSNATGSAGRINFSGPGTATLLGANSYSGATSIAAGTTVQLGNGGNSGTIGSGAISNSGHLVINRADSYTLSNDVAGSGNLSKLGAGTALLTGNNTYSGTTTISAGTLQVGDGSNNGTLGSGAVFNNAALVINRSGALTVSSDISGTGSVRQMGTGTTTLTGSNTYGGGTTISAGSLQIGNGGSTGSIGSGALSNQGTLLVNRSGTLALNMSITGSGSLVLDGGGTTHLAGTNTFSGGIEVAAGSTLAIADQSALGTGPLDLKGSSTVPAYFKINTSTRITNRITVQGDPVFDVVPGAIVTIATPIVNGSSAGDVVVQGGGTLALLATNTYTGPTTVHANSTLALTDAGSIATSTNVSNQGKLDMRGTTSGVVSVHQLSQGANGQLLMRTNTSGAQLLSVRGSANLDGTLSISAQPGSYKSGIFKLITADQVNGRFSSVSGDLGDYVRTYTLLYSPQGVDLEMVLGPDAVNSRQTLQTLGNGQTAVMKQRNQFLSDMLNQECLPSQAGQSCMEIQGRYGHSTLGSEGAGLISGAWQVSPTLRMGGYVEQGDIKLRTGDVTFSSNAPQLGGFLRWNAKPDGTGLQARMSFATQIGSLQMTRDKTTADTEAASGTASLQSYALGAELAWGIALGSSSAFSPYVSVQDTRSLRGAYAESASAQVAYPISYEAFEHNALYTTVGMRMSGLASERFSYQLSGGLQYKERRYGSDLSGSSAMYKLEAFSMDMRDTSANPEFTGAADLRYHLGQDRQVRARLTMRGPMSDAPQVFKVSLGYQVSF